MTETRPPDWIDQAAAELDRLPNPHAAKKRATIVALVDARLAGISEETVWTRPECCSRNAYHSKWKKDVLFADVLEKVETLARGWHNGRAMRALAQAAERLALASPVAVGKAIQMMNSADDQVALRAAFGILDRAGVETAEKSSSETVGMTLEEWRAKQSERQRKASQALDDFADDPE